MRKSLSPLIHLLVLGTVCLGLTGISIIQQMQTGYEKDIVSTAQAQASEAVMVLGAGVKLDGTPSDALRDRVTTGIRLYQAGKASKILMTGDDGAFHADEVATMKRLAVEAGVPEQDILVDEHGYRTYESCKRAVQVFHIKKGIVVTQRFHLSRALYLCSHLGMQAQGVPADLQSYQRIVFFTLRDYAASLKAWWDVNINPPASPVNY